MRRRALLELLIVVCGAILLTVAMTWPLAPQMGSVGRIDTGDGQVCIWNVSWVARAIVLAPRHIFDANIFYPSRNTLAFNENNVGAGTLAVPVYWATGNPYFTHNFVLLLSFVLTLAGTYYLVRHLVGSRPGAALAAVLFAFCPYVFSHTAHIQLMMTATLSFTLLAFHRVVERPEPGRAVVLGLLLFAAAVSCGYYGIFSALLVSFGSLFYLVSRRYWRNWSYYLSLLTAAGISAVLVWPFFRPYLQLETDGGKFRTLEHTADWSATIGAYLASGGLGHRWMLRHIGPWNEVLFPGFVAILAGAVGTWAVWRAWRERSGAPLVSDAPPAPDGARPYLHETGLFYGLVTVLAFWISFGPQAGLHQVLYRTVPIFSLLRAPARLGLLVVLGLSVLGAIGLARVTKGRRWAWRLALVLMVAALLETTPVPLRMEQVPAPSPIYRLLATLPDDPVVEFPYFFRRVDLHRNCLYMLNSTVHWKPLVNGYADYVPKAYLETMVEISAFPTQESFDLLRKRRARYVVFHFDFYDWRSREKVRARIEEWREHLRFLMRDGTDELYEIVKWPRY